MIDLSEIRIEGYSDATGRKIVYNATHRQTGISVTKAASPREHNPDLFIVNRSILITDLERELARSSGARAR